MNNILFPFLILHLFFREVGALVIHSPVKITKGDPFKDGARDPHAHDNMENLFLDGTWNCDFADEVRPQATDIILKSRKVFGDYKGSLLKETIESKGITRLFVMGFLTNVCVEATTKEASNLFPNLNIYVLRDGCAAKTKQVYLESSNHISIFNFNFQLMISIPFA